MYCRADEDIQTIPFQVAKPLLLCHHNKVIREEYVP